MASADLKNRANVAAELLLVSKATNQCGQAQMRDANHGMVRFGAGGSMDGFTLILLAGNSKDTAGHALQIAKKLDRDGWIELIDYVVVRKDKQGYVATRKMGNELAEKVAAACLGAAGGIIGGGVGGPIGAAAGVAAGAWVGAGLTEDVEQFWPEKVPDEFLQGLDPDSSALAVVVQDRYAERLEQEFRKLGRTVHRELKRAERDAEFEAYLARSKDKIRSIQDEIQTGLAKAQTATATEKTKIEADVAAKRAELWAVQAKLEDQIKEMNADLKSEVRELNFRWELAGLKARFGIATAINHLHRQLNNYHEELEDLIEHQTNALKTQSSDLKTQAAKANGEAKAAIENHLQSIERHLHHQRAKLQESYEERLMRMKQWFETLRVDFSLLQANVRDKFQATISGAQRSLAELKALVHMRRREDDRAWKDIRAGFHKATKDLELAFKQANRERV